MSFLDKTFSLHRKTVLVTGAGRGIGRALAEGLLRANATVILVDVDTKNLTQVAEAFRHEGLDVHYIPCDLSQSNQIDTLANRVCQQFDRLDVLVNNAGVSIGHDAMQYPLEDWERTMQINLRAPFLLVQRLAALMQDCGGSIINVTSINAEMGFPGNPAYVAAKGGLKQLTKAMAVDLGRFGIRVNNIGPGYFATDMTKQSYEDPQRQRQRAERTILGRWGTPKDMMGLVLLLASDASSYITGQDIYADGGWLAKGM